MALMAWEKVGRRQSRLRAARRRGQAEPEGQAEQQQRRHDDAGRFAKLFPVARAAARGRPSTIANTSRDMPRNANSRQPRKTVAAKKLFHLRSRRE